MKKYNVPNYVRYKKDVIACQPDEEIALEDLNESGQSYNISIQDLKNKGLLFEEVIK